MENRLPNKKNDNFRDEEDDIHQREMQQNTITSTTVTTGYSKNDIEERKEDEIVIGKDGESESSSYNLTSQQGYFIDHYSIKSRSSSVHCHDSIIHIYDQRNKQLVIEDKALHRSPLRRRWRRWPASSSSDGSDDTTTTTTTTTSTTFPLSSFQDDNDESCNTSPPSSQITVKYIKNGSSGLNLLRIIYTLIAFLLSGFLFIFCLEILLLLFSNLLLSIGPTSSVPDSDDGQNFTFGIFMGTFFSVPLYVYAMSSVMSIANSFIVDAWSGHVDLRGVTVGSWVEWSGVVVMLAVPLVVMSGYLMVGSDEWWEVGGLTWIFCLFAFFLCYAGSVIYFEFSACVKLFRLMKEMERRSNGGDEEGGEEVGLCRWFGFLKRVLYLHQLHNYAGSKSISFFLNGSCSPLTKEEDIKNHGSDLTSSTMTDNHLNNDDGSEHIAEGESIGLYSRVTTWEPMSLFFTKLDPPVLIRDLSPSVVSHNQMTFVTKNNWSLGNLVINPAMTSFIVVKGPDAITLPQVRSSFAFLLLTIIVLVLVVFTLLVWCEINFGVSFGISIVVALCWTPRVKISLEALKIYEAAIAEAASRQQSRTTDDDTTAMLENEENNQNQVIYRVTHTFRVTMPSNVLCWFLLLCQVTFFFIWPLATLYFVGDMNIFIFFIVLGIITGARLYFNPMTLLAEFGSRNCNPSSSSSIQGNDHQRQFDSNSLNWKDQVRLNLIIDKVSQTRNRHLWQSVFLSATLVIIVVFISAFTTSEEEAYESKTQNLTTYLPDFYYHQPPGNLEYPTCRMKKVFNVGISDSSISTSLLDHAFLSLLAYYSPEDTQYHLDRYFGSGVAINQQQIVDDFKASLSDDLDRRPVVYKLIAFPHQKLRIVTIRGTTDAWELLADFQLWAGSAFAKCLRGLIPLGRLWNPIIPTLLQMASFVGDLGKISFYKETTKFVHHIRLNPSYEGTNYTNVHVTGHSLGGGLAIISGSQTGVPTVAISAPNAMLSRKTFDPPLSKERLDSFAFNVMPNNDVIPRFDDPGRLFQKIQCRATSATPFYCHSMLRSTCEIMYKCGTTNAISNGGVERRRYDRPAFCECVVLFGYPEPLPSGNRTFARACADIDA